MKEQERHLQVESASLHEENATLVNEVGLSWFPQSCKSIKIISSWKMGKTNNVMQIENIMKKSWNFSIAIHESRTRSSDNSISLGLLQ